VHSSSARIHGDASGIVMKNSTKSITGLVGDAEVISYYIIMVNKTQQFKIKQYRRREPNRKSKSRAKAQILGVRRFIDR